MSKKKKQKYNIELKSPIMIFGSPWTITFNNNLLDLGYAGLTHTMENHIDVVHPKKNRKSYRTDEACLRDFKHVLKHELLHSAMHQLGLDHYCDDEVLIDLLALKWDEINSIFKEAGAL